MRRPAPAPRAAGAVAACAALWALAAGAHADPRIDLIFASDLAGDLHAQECGQKTPRPGVGLGALASAIGEARAQSPASLVIAGGGLLGPGGGARFLLHSETGSRAAARLVRDAGIEIVSPGVHEFAIARETLIGYLDELRTSGPAPLCSNIACDKARPELCRLLASSHRVTRGGVRVGVIAALPEDAPQRIGPGHLHGASVTPWTRLSPVARELRAQVDVLVVELDLGGRFGIESAIEFARALDTAGAHADVIHVTRQDDPRGGFQSLSLAGGTLLVGTPAYGSGVTQVTAELRPVPDGGTGRPSLALHTARIRSPAEPAPPPPLAEALTKARTDLCERWGTVLAELPPPGLDRAAVTQLVLDAMRDAGHAELALINSGALSDRGLPLKSASVSAIGDVMPFKAQVVVSNLTGQAISDALQKYASQESAQRLRISGLRRKDGNLQINGRPLITTARYRTVTIDFLAAGGNGLLPEKFLPPGSTVVSEDLRQLVLDYLRKSDMKRAVPPPLQLERRPLWRVALDLGIDLQNVSVSNPGNAYDRPQLVRQPSLAFKLDGTLRAEMDHPTHLAQLSLRTLYGQSWLRTAVMSTDMMPTDEKTWLGQETADLVNALALYSYRGFSEKRPRLPTPYLSLGLESEFNRPDTRTYLHFELSGVFGMRVALPASITANLGIGVRSELLASTDSDAATERELARARFLLTTLIEMPKRALVPRLGSALLGEFSVSYSFTDPMLLRSHELRGIGKLYIALGRPLYLTIGNELYVYRDRDNEAGVALDLNVGLKVVLSGHRQQF